MILSPHAVVGAAIANLLPAHPGAAFVLGFASHFALDAIPHADYPLRSASLDPKIGVPLRFDRALLQDAITIGADGLVGLLFALFLFSFSREPMGDPARRIRCHASRCHPVSARALPARAVANASAL